MSTAKPHSAQPLNSHSNPHPHWGAPPWHIDFAVRSKPVPASVDFAIVGGGFTGLAAAAWLRRLAPEKSVAVFEADRIGAGASGRTGGMALAESAAGHLPGLGNVLGGLERILAELDIDCDLSLPGAFEIGRGKALKNSPIRWNDSGTLRVVKKVPGGTLDPGKLVAGLARVADERGATIIENHPVTQIEWRERPVVHAVVHAGRARCSAGKILFATNALALELTSLAGRAEPKLTLAVLTEPVEEKRLEAIGLAGGNPFYTVDLPYLWGRCRATEASSSALAWWTRTIRAISGRLTSRRATREICSSRSNGGFIICIPSCAKSKSRTGGAARFFSARTGARSSCRIRKVKMQSY